MALTKKVHAYEDPELSRKYRPVVTSTAEKSAIKPTYVTIKGPGGTIDAGIEAPLGNVKRPVPPERISQKFYEYADPVLGRERGAKLEKRILEMSASNDVVGLLAV